MTQDEFDTAIYQLIHGIDEFVDDRERDAYGRVFAATGFAMRDLASRTSPIPDEVEWSVPLAEVPTYLFNLNRRQRKLLKEIADDLNGGREH